VGAAEHAAALRAHGAHTVVAALAEVRLEGHRVRGPRGRGAGR
jgi:hypothetical protein